MLHLYSSKYVIEHGKMAFLRRPTAGVKVQWILPSPTRSVSQRWEYRSDAMRVKPPIILELRAPHREQLQHLDKPGQIQVHQREETVQNEEGVRTNEHDVYETQVINDQAKAEVGEATNPEEIHFSHGQQYPDPEAWQRCHSESIVDQK